ncbi:MAG TPA: LysR family transcriptional regulator [Terricaulis sp.]|nr:LysR family transcriptional regulator [Terricaulis sp.]HRP09449.1 LysR family transcriptional regulator [Terricaulis sp.]
MSAHIGIRELRLFLGVAEASSFSECARVHNISQPALSRTIKLLEERIGARLFHRDTRTVRLTPAGQQLQQTAERLVREFELGMQELDQFVSGARGRFAIAALPSLAALILPRALAQFHALRPDVDCVILDALSESVVEDVNAGRADIGVALRPPPSKQLSYTELFVDQFGLVCAPSDPLATAPSVSWRSFLDRPFVAMAEHSSVRMMTDAAFIQNMTPLKNLFECSHLATTGALIAEGLGVSALPQSVMPLLGVRDLVWRPLDNPALFRSIGLIRRRDRPLHAAAAAFVEILMRQEPPFGLRPPSRPAQNVNL